MQFEILNSNPTSVELTIPIYSLFLVSLLISIYIVSFNVISSLVVTYVVSLLTSESVVPFNMISSLVVVSRISDFPPHSVTYIAWNIVQ